MKNIFALLKFFTLASCALSLEQDNVVGVLANDERFTTLVLAVQTAELVDTLQGEGPFTILAPTDDAFDKIPAEDLESLLQDKPALTTLLLRHVIPAKVLSGDIIDGDITTIGGEVITASVSGGVVTFTNADGVSATVIEADILASNGVIHAINNVI